MCCFTEAEQRDRPALATFQHNEAATLVGPGLRFSWTEARPRDGAAGCIACEAAKVALYGDAPATGSTA